MDELLVSLWVGVAAQLVEGLAGYGYGATGSALLLASGMPPLAAAASLHGAGLTTQGIGAALHWRLGNVDPRAWRRLVLGGLAGVAAGVLLALALAPAQLHGLAIAALLGLGVLLLLRARQHTAPAAVTSARGAAPGFVAGLLATGTAAGWSTVTTPALQASGLSPRQVEGSGSAARFCVALAAGAALVLLLGRVPLLSILGLLAGAVLAAPLAVRLNGLLQPRQRYALVGLLVLSITLVGVVRLA